jgi:hypothetical protein
VGCHLRIGCVRAAALSLAFSIILFKLPGLDLEACDSVRQSSSVPKYLACASTGNADRYGLQFIKVVLTVCKIPSLGPLLSPSSLVIILGGREEFQDMQLSHVHLSFAWGSVAV